MSKEVKLSVYSHLDEKKLQEIAYYGDAQANDEVFLYKGYYFSGVRCTFDRPNSPVAVLGEFVGNDPRVHRFMIAIKEESVENGFFRLSHITYFDGEWTDAYDYTRKVLEQASK